MLLSVLCGTGVQVFSMYLVLMGNVSFFFFLNPFHLRSPPWPYNPSFCSPWLLVSSKPWQPLDGYARTVCPDGYLCWLLLCNHIQAHARRKLEEKYPNGIIPISPPPLSLSLFLCSFQTALLLPGIVFAIVIFLNFFLVAEGSSGAVGFGTTSPPFLFIFFIELDVSILM